MERKEWRIYLGEVPHSEKGVFWVSFESDPRLKRTKENIYGKCLPCIQHLYAQLKAGRTEIDLGRAFHCWKTAAVLDSIDTCFLLLSRFESRFPVGHVYGKLGSGRPDSKTKAVVYHTDNEEERDRIREALKVCLEELAFHSETLISRACAALYEPILGDWREWGPITAIRFPERVAAHVEYIKRTMFWSTM